MSVDSTKIHIMLEMFSTINPIQLLRQAERLAAYIYTKVV